MLGNEENAGEGLLFLGNYMALDHSRGAVLIVDDHSESVHMVHIRPRKSWHGGGEPSAFELMLKKKAKK